MECTEDHFVELNVEENGQRIFSKVTEGCLMSKYIFMSLPRSLEVIGTPKLFLLLPSDHHSIPTGAVSYFSFSQRSPFNLHLFSQNLERLLQFDSAKLDGQTKLANAKLSGKSS